MRRDVLALAVVTTLAVGAAEAPRSVASSDPCGDLGRVRAGGEELDVQPDDWDRADLAGLTVHEVLDADDTVAGVDVELLFCGDVRAPQDPGEFVQVTWPLDDRCDAVVADGASVNETHLSDNVGLVLGPGSPRISIRCIEPVTPWDMVATTSTRELVALPDGAVTRSGPLLRFSLRVAELGTLGQLVDDGATIAAAATSYAVFGTTSFGDAGDLEWSVGSADWAGVTPALTLGD